MATVDGRTFPALTADMRCVSESDESAILNMHDYIDYVSDYAYEV
jgi:hypothetical protein